jgi:drug/metabolite transporter (DMT)-like permease
MAQAQQGAAAAPEENPRLGILWMLLTMAMFVSMDACAKTLAQTYDTLQVVWGRYFFHVVILAIMLGPRLPRTIRTTRPGLQLIRSLLLFATTFCFFTGLQWLQLAEASSVMFVSPLIVTALSAPILKEPVGPRRWAGVVIGFLGALVIIRPGTDVMQLAALWPLAGAFFYASYQISTRYLGSSDPVLTTLAYSALIGAVASSVLVPFVWEMPDATGWVLMAATGLIGGLGHFAMIKSLSYAPAAVVAPFGYTNLIWATLLGFLVFSDLPDLWTLVGAAIIAGSGLYIFRREQQAKRAG